MISNCTQHIDFSITINETKPIEYNYTTVLKQGTPEILTRDSKNLRLKVQNR